MSEFNISNRDNELAENYNADLRDSTDIITSTPTLLSMIDKTGRNTYVNLREQGEERQREAAKRTPPPTIY